VLQLLRQQHPEVSAVAFANDQLACGALMQASQMGLKVPDTLAMLGFGDFPIGRQLEPALSTMRAPRAEIGRAAADIVLRCLRDGAPPESRWLPCELVPRQSTGPARR
jgi:LacI family gluconate utilization system Gnt-I transcriptional repressor